MEEIKYYKCVHLIREPDWYDADGKHIDEPKDTTSDNVKVMYDMVCVEKHNR